MAGFFDSLATVNSVARTLLGVVIVGCLGGGTWLAYDAYYADKRVAADQAKQLADVSSELEGTRTTLRKTAAELQQRQAELEQREQEIVSLREDVQERDEQIERLDTSLRLLKVSHRLARFTAVDQQRDPETGNLATTIEFVELNDEGHPITEPRRFEIRGDVVYIDNWVVKFEDKYVEQADVDRSTSLVLFRRIFGEYQEPNEGFPLDRIGVRPEVYARGGQPSELEQKIWNDFWNIANDRSQAEELGIRAAHGEAVSIRVREGQSYRLLLRASDGLSVVPEEAPPAPPAPANRPAT